MRRFLMGFIVGALLFSALPAIAVGLTGKQIQGVFPLFLNGKRCTNDVIVVDGTSYLPVRAAADQFGYDIVFSEAEKQVLMSRKGEPFVTVSTEYPVTSDVSGLGIRPNPTTDYVKLDGTDYATLGFMPAHITWDGKTATATLLWGTYLVEPKRGYTVGCNGFIEGVKIFFKLSALGLRAKVSSGTLTISR